MDPMIRAGSTKPSVRARRAPMLSALALLSVAASCDPGPDRPTLESLGMRETEPELPMCTEAADVGAPVSALRVDTIASGLDIPWDVTFLPDGRALFTERPGRIRVVAANGTLDPEPWRTLDVYAQEEVGLMGIDARVTDGGGVEVFVAATHRRLPSGQIDRIVSGVWRRLVRLVDSERGHPTTLQVLRIPEVEGRGGEPGVVVSGMPAFILHGGGALRFGPDGLLYVSNGDATEPWTAHDPESMRGKILRFDSEGRPAGALPDASSPVFAMGIRHVQGMSWDDTTGQMFAIDHGPSGMIQEDYRGNRDELNALEAGDHLGWPIATGTTEGGPFVSALTTWVPAIAPGGFDLYQDDRSPWAGSALIAGLRGESLRRVEVERDDTGEWSARCEDSLLLQDFGRLRMVRTAPDGTVWLSTSNTDGRGVPRPGDDLLLRLHPPGLDLPSTSYR
jgi:aldose sugar dehydrogenase